MKEKDTKKEKLIYYDFKRFRDLLVRNNSSIDSKQQSLVTSNYSNGVSLMDNRSCPNCIAKLSSTKKYMLKLKSIIEIQEQRIKLK